MNEEQKILQETAKALGIDKITPEIYNDLLKPTVQKIGKDLLLIAKAVSISLAPIKGLVWSYDKIEEWLWYKLTKRLSNTSPKNIQVPNMNIAGQIFMNLPFCRDEKELRELYANLLASAMDKEYQSRAHPAYVSIIQQLNPDEAKILKWICDESITTIATEKTDERGFTIENTTWIFKKYEEICIKAEVKYPELAANYFENLIRLKILSSENNSEIKYIPEGGNEYGTYDASVKKTNISEVYLTEFGKSFIDICVREI